jgi:hypothetical protein
MSDFRDISLRNPGNRNENEHPCLAAATSWQTLVNAWISAALNEFIVITLYHIQLFAWL